MNEIYLFLQLINIFQLLQIHAWCLQASYFMEKWEDLCLHSSVIITSNMMEITFLQHSKIIDFIFKLIISFQSPNQMAYMYLRRLYLGLDIDWDSLRKSVFSALIVWCFSYIWYYHYSQLYSKYRWSVTNQSRKWHLFRVSQTMSLSQIASPEVTSLTFCSCTAVATLISQTLQ